MDTLRVEVLWSESEDGAREWHTTLCQSTPRVMQEPEAVDLDAGQAAAIYAALDKTGSGARIVRERDGAILRCNLA